MVWCLVILFSKNISEEYYRPVFYLHRLILSLQNHAKKVCLMKIMHEQLSFEANNSFKVKWDDFPHFTYPWHFHSEYEIVYVIKSFGKRFVADHIEDFGAGDLVLLGNNLPHFWKSDDAFFKNDPNYKVNAIVIHFPIDFFKDQIENYPEFFKIKDLLKRALRGVSFDRVVSDNMGKKIKHLLRLKGIERTLYFIKILDQLANSKQYKLLASESYQPDVHDWSNSRLEKIMHIINSNYRHSLKLETVANHIGMNPTAFCRYFKEKTGKSFSQFLIDMRVGYACKLLIEDKLSVSQICFESGFNNLSNFNRQFKKNTSYSPTEFKGHYHEVNAR